MSGDGWLHLPTYLCLYREAATKKSGLFPKNIQTFLEKHRDFFENA